MLTGGTPCPIRQRALDTRLMRLFGETNTRPKPSRLTAAPPNRQRLNNRGPGNRKVVGRYGRI